MNVARGWFEEASKVLNVHKDSKGEFIIYKGFKLTKSEETGHSVQDVRHSEFYTYLSVDDYATLLSKGFLVGADYISNQRSIQSIEDYREEIEALRAKKELAKKEMKLDVRLNKKRIRLSDESILEFEDLIKLAQARIEQFNFKYNKNE